MKSSGCLFGGLFWMFVILLHPVSLVGQNVEICNNAIDDDGDGKIDLNDSDCVCEVIEPVSRIPNPSFEQTSCCPESRSELFCADGWIQASLATTDLIHDCGWGGWPQFSPPKPFPDGEGIVGFRDGRGFDNSENVQFNWKEYAGACLTAPLLAGETYRFEFYVGFVSAITSPLIEVTFFGTSACDYMPFNLNNENFGCPTNSPEWTELSSVRIGWNRGWREAQLEITPEEDIYAIAIGPGCRPTNAKLSTYYFLDKLVLDESKNFTWVIEGEGNPCGNDYALQVENRPNFSYQWYKEGIALVGEDQSRIDGISEGNYQVRIENNEICIVTGIYNYTIPVLEKELDVSICAEDHYDFGSQGINETGNYNHTFRSAHGCDSVVFLNLEVLSTHIDTLYAKIFKGEKYNIDDQSYEEEGEHVVKRIDRIGCEYFTHLFLDNYDVYWPNVFSPNNDGNNDFFNIYGGPDLVGIKQLNLFDRWGAKIFTTNNLVPNEANGWDGRFSGITIGEGVYVFQAILEMQSGLEKDIYGSVLVMR